MMFYLIRDVCPGLFDHGLADREHAVTALPIELLVLWPLVLHPSRGCCLHRFDKVGDRDRPGEIAKGMQVILRAINQNGLAFNPLKDNRQVSMKALSDFRVRQ